MILGILFIILLAILPITVVIMVITAIVKRSKSNDTTSIKQFEKSIRSIYIYIVLICLLCTIIAGTIYLFRSTLDLVLPENSNVTPDQLHYAEIQKNENIVGIFTSCAMLVSSIPLFVYYNKLAKKDD